jgi:minor extracellular serine protease Vpr
MDHIVGFDSVKRSFKNLSINMKNLILFTFLFLSVFFSWGQENPRVVIPSGNAKGLKPPSKPHAVLPNKGFSPQSAFLLMELDKLKKENRAIQPADSILIERYNLFYIGSELFVNSFLIINEEFDKAKFESKGGFVNSTSKSIATASVPVNRLNEIIEIEGILYVQIAEKAERTMDTARNATWVNLVHQGQQLPQSYFGTGVVIGVIDNGFDYTHPNFYDGTGSNNYRVKRVWEQSATTGTPPSGFTYGRELTTQSAILNAQKDQIDNSHGTHVAGIAGGAGVGVNTTLSGVAPQSELVFVATPMTTVSIADGIQYIINYANSQNKPCVINISIGSNAGPHDGFSPFDQYCEGVVGNGKILVGAAGNEGQKQLYVGKSYTTNDNTLYSFVQFPNSSDGTNGTALIDIWGNPNQNYEVAVNIYNTNTNSFEDWTPYIQANSNNTFNYTLFDDDFFLPDACSVTIATSLYPGNNKRNVQILIDHTAQDDNYRWAMVEIIANTGQTKMWAATGGSQFTNVGRPSPWVNGSTNSTVMEIGGTGNAIISVGAYTSKNSWTAFNLSSQIAPYFAPVGAIAPFSSKGPTADNRIKPDITAPGNILASSVSRFDNSYTSLSGRTVSGVNNGTNNWYFGMMEGTSMASPMVTGILALWLQAYPDLNPTQALNLIKQNALTDSFTGIIPSAGSNTWGWGKVNAHQGLVNLLASLPPMTTITALGDLSPCQGQLVQLNAPLNYPYYQWSNGETTQSISVTNSGDYFVRVANNQGYISPWSSPVSVNFNPLPSIPLITENGINLVSSSNSGNQWYLNNTPIAGATGQTYSPSASGTYYVQVTNSNGCSENSAPFNFAYTPAPIAQFQSNLNQVCAGECIVFTDNSSNQPTNWSWVFQGGTPSSSSSQTPSTICYQIPGTYFVSLTVSNAGGSDVQTSSGYITVTATPSIPAISANGNQLTSSASQGNQWYLNNVPISGATGQTYSPTASGTYYLQVTNSNGCSEMSQPFVFVYTNAPFAAFSTQNNDQALCVGDCINFLDQSANSPTSWQWSFPGGTPSSSTAQNPPFICYNNPGDYLVALTVSNAGGSDAITTNAYITVVNDPQTPIISVDGNVLTSSANTGNQWYLNGVAINGAMGQTHLATQSGNYSVIVTNATGCSTASTGVNLTVTDLEEVIREMEGLLYPNPSSGVVMVQSADRIKLIEVFDLSGKLLLSTTDQQFDLSPFAEGVYVVRLHGDSAVINQKLIKTNK